MRDWEKLARACRRYLDAFNDEIADDTVLGSVGNDLRIIAIREVLPSGSGGAVRLVPAPPAPRTDRSLRDLIYDAMGRLGDWEEGVIQPNNMDLDNYSHWRGVAADVAREVLAAGWTRPRATSERAIPEPTEGTQA